jgi:hypothetical protein
MAVIMNQTMPEGLPIEMLDGVTEEMNVKADPPAGLLLHVHYEDGGRVRITDVWESEQAYESFREQRLTPAMEKVAAAHGMDLSQSPQPETVFLQVRDVVTGS